MSTTPFSVEMLVKGIPFVDRDLDVDILHAFYTNQEALAEQVNENIKARTRIATGALRSSEKYEINYDPTDATLVRFYADAVEQVEQYKRVYVSYQEGQPLGQDTYTGEGKQMYYSQTQGAGVELLSTWGYDTLYGAINTYVADFT